MQQITNSSSIEMLTPDRIRELMGKDIEFCAFVLRIRKASGITFVMLRLGKYIYQSVYIAEICKNGLSNICDGAYIKVNSRVKEEKRAEYGFELTLMDFEPISVPMTDYPLNVSQPVLGCTIDDNIKNRPIALRHPREFAIMQIYDAIRYSFGEFMRKNGFTGIATPQISAETQQDNDYIKIKYFGENAVLNKSPKLYKKLCVSAMDRVYETGKGYCGRNKNCAYILNEFTRLDFELSYTDIKGVMTVLISALNYITDTLKCDYADELNLLGAKLPSVGTVCEMTFDEAIAILGKTDSFKELDPTDRAKICAYATENHNSDMIFISEYPSDGAFCHYTNGKADSFLLLYKGLEIAKGEMGIYDYDEQLRRFEELNIDPSQYKVLTDTLKCGMPPHGGGAIGVERFMMKLLDLENIRYASLFPRDLHYLKP